MAAICGWWFVRNIALYGDPFGWTVYRQAWASMMRTAPPSVSELAEIADIAWRSYWGWFGWLTLDVGDWLHIAANVLVGAAAWGAWAQRRFFLAQRTWHAGIIVCAGIVGLHLAYLIGQNILQTAVMAQGRHFFPAAGAAMLLTASGLCAGDGRRGAWAAAAMAAANIACLLAVVVPTYS
jgi:hypothetical protein